ncbi:unnamed protein product, partial [Candidula unifasciata]
MTSRREMCSGLFQPLTGQEKASRLEEKFGYYLDSDDETEASDISNQAKISKLRKEVDISSKWLNSQTGSSSLLRGNNRMQQKRKSHEERPSLTMAPTSDKVGFRLSADDVQPSVIVPATINQYLRDYQREGIRFLYQHYIAKTGAILGDDMGLGKTIQVIGFLAALLGKQGTQTDTLHNIPKFIRQMSDDIPSSPPKQAHKPFLIIGPSAVMYNWLDELKTWGYFSASKFHGADKETCLNNLKKGKLEVVVTTFETFRDNTTVLNQVEWEAVIVDEVHKIKGLKAQITHALKTVKAPCRFGLTGTVLQNNMSELWSLFDWVQPGILGTLEQFETDFVQTIENGQRHDATKRELAQARKRKDAFSDIRKRLMLRRTKALIADQLPSKEDMVVMCRLSEMQRSVYKAVLSHPDMKLVLCAKDPCDCRSGKFRASCCYKLLDIIEQYVIGQGHVYRRIDGKTSSHHRHDIVKQFNSDSSIFLCLISTKAGGLGLNLTGANRVVIFDPNWNPSHDLQAQDRAYRIGQTRDVKVYRLVSAGTIEENVYLRQIYKQQLDQVVIGTTNARRYFHGIQGDKGNCGELFGIKNMFSLRTGSSCLTMDILKRNDKIERGLAGYDITHYVPPHPSLTTDVIQDDDENSERDDRQLLDSSSDEEDEEFLRNLFGSERSHDEDIDQQAVTKNHSEAALNDSHKFPNTLEEAVRESDSDDDQFSLIPNLRKRPVSQLRSTEKPVPSLLAPGLSSLSSEKTRLLSPDTVAFTGITFSSRTYRNSDVCDQRFEAAETVHRGAVSGLSWLFDDSDDEKNINKRVERKAAETNKMLVDFKKNKLKDGTSATSGPEETLFSHCAARSNVNPGRNISTERLKAGTGRATSAAEAKASTSKGNISLEQLVLKSNDVIHTHANAKVVGSSRAEDHMTNCAMQDVFELHTNSQAPALQCDPYSQEKLPEQQKKGRRRQKPDSTVIKCNISGSFLLVGQTP